MRVGGGHRDQHSLQPLRLPTSFFLFLYGDPSQAFDSFLSPENLMNYDMLFNKALSSVDLDSDYYKRILRSKISIDYAILESYRKNFSDSFQLTVLQNDIKSVNPKLIKRLNDFKNTCINNNITFIIITIYIIIYIIYKIFTHIILFHKHHQRKPLGPLVLYHL